MKRIRNRSLDTKENEMIHYPLSAAWAVPELYLLKMTLGIHYKGEKTRCLFICNHYLDSLNPW